MSPYPAPLSVHTTYEGLCIITKFLVLDKPRSMQCFKGRGTYSKLCGVYSKLSQLSTFSVLRSKRVSKAEMPTTVEKIAEIEAEVCWLGCV